MIINDECHSIKNNTTKKFYEYILSKYKDISCIGFSATPYLEYEPFKNILSEYTIYNAYCDKVIVAPKIKWLSNNILDNEEILEICQKNINELYFKKILIVWCGIIDKCYSLSLLWKKN